MNHSRIVQCGVNIAIFISSNYNNICWIKIENVKDSETEIIFIRTIRGCRLFSPYHLLNIPIQFDRQIYLNVDEEITNNEISQTIKTNVPGISRILYDLTSRENLQTFFIFIILLVCFSNDQMEMKNSQNSAITCLLSPVKSFNFCFFLVFKKEKEKKSFKYLFQYYLKKLKIQYEISVTSLTYLANIFFQL
jgi:hypothetical protein